MLNILALERAQFYWSQNWFSIYINSLIHCKSPGILIAARLNSLRAQAKIHKVKRQQTLAKKEHIKKATERRRERGGGRKYEISLLWPFISWKKCCVSTKAPFQRYIQIESKAFEKEKKSQQHTNTHTNLFKQSSAFVGLCLCQCLCVPALLI